MVLPVREQREIADGLPPCDKRFFRVALVSSILACTWIGRTRGFAHCPRVAIQLRVERECGRTAHWRLMESRKNSANHLVLHYLEVDTYIPVMTDNY